MTTSPGINFHRRYTAAEFITAAMKNGGRYELLEGAVIARPRPSVVHAAVNRRLWAQLDGQLPPQLLAVPEIEVDLQLSVPLVRVPDIVVVPAALEDAGKTATAADVLLAVEVISPSSVRTDTMTKPLDYAEAGIPHLWLIDPGRPVSATILTLVDGKYEQSPRTEHSFTVTEPFPLTIDLDQLRRSPDRG